MTINTLTDIQAIDNNTKSLNCGKQMVENIINDF